MTTGFRERARRAADHPLDWLAALLLSWVIPLGLAGHWWKLSYRVSLMLWGVPVLLLLPRFLSRARDPRLRRAFVVTVAYIVLAGSVLDFILGSWILRFDPDGDYLLKLPSWSRLQDFVPIEEVLFYVLGGIAIVLTYFWADEFWLSSYQPDARAGQGQRRGAGLIVLSPPVIAVGLIMLAAGTSVASLYAGSFRIPLYFTFLVVTALVPAIALYRSAGSFVNWRAFSFTALYVLLTSCIWEVTLALPHKWWGYRESAMMGKYVEAWQFGEWAYPIEALMVWLVVTFSAVLTFEAVKMYHVDPRPRRERFFGSRP